MRFLKIAFMLLISTCAYAQDSGEWSWNQNDREIPIEKYFYETIKTNKNEDSFYSKLIWIYKNTSSQKKLYRCPSYPSCSTFALYSIQKYGLIKGLLMGMDRLYFRENTNNLSSPHYHSLIINEEEKIYDIPEANYIFDQKDWRIIDPNFFYHFFDQ
jgi:hypothetical protein